MIFANINLTIMQEISLPQKECPIGPEANLLEPSADQCKRIILETPILSPGELLLLKEPLLPAWKVFSYFCDN